VGAHPNQTTRVVLETTVRAECRAAAAAGAGRLLVSCRDTAAAASSAPAATPAPPPPLPAPVIVTGGTASLPRPGTAAATPPPPAAAAAAPLTPSANQRGGYSIARQLGLRVGRIVIDAGHGGRDPGALDPGLSEATITLDIALRLEKLLAREPGITVVLTRRTDEYVSLQDRTAIANSEAADLFVSIHVNANRDRTIRGVETYVLNFASTPDAAAVAARENASSTLTMSHLNDLVKQIALENKVVESRDLAGRIQDALVRKLTIVNKSLRDLGVKQAPFVVLVGAGMPSVLVEVAFLTYSRERELLASGGYRERIAEALVDGIRRYLQTLKRVETVPGRTSPGPGAAPRERLQ
jgi:N-acetylmuramoyl-L-alanine amidase